MSGGVLPDLRYSSALSSDLWYHIVLDGQLQSEGMVSFAKELSHEDVKLIRGYVIFRSQQTLAQEKPSVQAKPKSNSKLR